MKTLQQLLIQTKTQQITGALDKDITAIEMDSRKVIAGAAFCCYYRCAERWACVYW